jgi:hypothetical protein
MYHRVRVARNADASLARTVEMRVLLLLADAHLTWEVPTVYPTVTVPTGVISASPHNRSSW